MTELAPGISRAATATSEHMPFQGHRTAAEWEETEMRRRRQPSARGSLNLPRWRTVILEALPQCRESVEWAERKLDRCESQLESVFVMLMGVMLTGTSNVSFAGEFPPNSSGEGKRYILDLAQQVSIAGYRCDFLLTVRSVASQRAMRVAIECDGHAFHDRTPEQASADRQRDRKLIALGVPTLRYTYSDLTQRSHESMLDLFGTIKAIANTFCDQDPA